MVKIQTLNKIDPKGLEIFPEDQYQISEEVESPDAIIVRSYKMNDMEMPSSLKAIARAGAGVNNIPLDTCTDKGIVVFNTPGANANGVKEIVIAGLMLSSRGIADSIEWAKTLDGKGDEIPALVEKGKKNYGGQEIKGKTLAIFGLGAIGVLVANAAQSLGMKVVGYDPYMSVNAALKLSRNVTVVSSVDQLLSDADYVTLHVPQTPDTKNFINSNTIATMKDGVRILNFSRGGLVNNDDVLKAIESGKVSRYVTDFPDASVINKKNVIAIPHLGASTEESETNCAIMAVNQTRDFLENGNIVNSVNFPNAELERCAGARILISNKNIPNMVGQISGVLAQFGCNIANMLNKNRNDIAYNIIDVDRPEVDADIFAALSQIEGVNMVRTITAL